MKTIRDLIDDIRTSIHANSVDVDDRTLISWINGQRALWIKNEMNKGKDFDIFMVQKLPCLELEVADASMCGLINTEHRIMRTIQKIPNTISNNYNDGITSVRIPIMIAPRLNYISREDSIFAGNTRFTKRDIFVFKHNNRFWIKYLPDNIHMNFMTHLAIEGLFEDPLEIIRYNDCNNNPCFDEEKEVYPLSDVLWQYIMSAVVEHRFGLLKPNILDQVPQVNEPTRQNR